MPIPSGSKVYIDTMILIYHLIDPTHPEERHCRRFLKEIETGHLTGVVTTFVVHEAVDVAKRLMAKRYGRELSLLELQAVQEDIERELNRLGVEQHDADALAIAALGQAPVFERSGHIIFHSGSTRTSINTTRGRQDVWKSVGGADAVHISFAERAGASHYATCDSGFSKLSGNVTPAILRDQYP